MDPLDKMVRKLFPCESNGKKRSTTFDCQIQPLIIRQNIGLTLVSDSVKKKFSNCFILIRRIISSIHNPILICQALINYLPIARYELLTGPVKSFPPTSARHV